MTPVGDEWDDERPASPGEILSALWADRTRLALVTLSCVAASGLYAFTATPVYRASVVMSPAASSRAPMPGSNILGQLGGLASLAGVSLEARDSTTEEALAVLRSREFIEHFISDHDLLPQLFPRHWYSIVGKSLVPSGRRPTLGKGFKYFNNEVLSVSRDKRTGLVVLAIDWREPNEAARWANELVGRLNSEMRLRAESNATAYTEYLEKELSTTQLVETRQAISRLMEVQINQKMVASVTPEYAFRTVDRALPPDVDDRVSPKRLLIVAVGAVLGLLLGSVLPLGFGSGTGRLRARSIKRKSLA
jgi:uncharacterized protein involved in exopolysaccharide biosynthesis